MALFLVPLQLAFFGMGSVNLSGPPLDFHRVQWEKDNRSGTQWLKSVLAYCEFRAGAPWRRLSEPSQRWNAERLWYLNGVRAVNDVLHAPERATQLALPSLSPCTTISKHTAGLAALDRGTLVSRLMEASPLFSNRRLLSRLSKLKLARMVERAEAEMLELERRRA